MEEIKNLSQIISIKTGGKKPHKDNFVSSILNSTRRNAAGRVLELKEGSSR